jgi:hypothetical protein
MCRHRGQRAAAGAMAWPAGVSAGPRWVFKGLPKTLETNLSDCA